MQKVTGFVDYVSLSCPDILDSAIKMLIQVPTGSIIEVIQEISEGLIYGFVVVPKRFCSRHFFILSGTKKGSFITRSKCLIFGNSKIKSRLM